MAVCEKAQNEAKLLRMLVIGSSQLRTNQGGIEQAKRTQLSAGGKSRGAA